MSGITPSQTVGPYFAYGLTPKDYGRRELVTNDLTAPDVMGARIRIEGRVLDGDGAAVSDAMIEIWQADAAGRYAQRANSSFKGFGRTGTDTQGHFAFTTIKPGPVAGPDGATQAPHIAVIVFARGVLRHLYTRIYFPEDAPAHAGDAVLKAVPADRRATLIARATGANTYGFDINLQGPDETVFFES